MRWPWSTPRERPDVHLEGTVARLGGPASTFPDAYRGLRAGARVTVELRGPVAPPWKGASTVGVYIGDRFAGVVNCGAMEREILALARTSRVLASGTIERVAGDLCVRVHLPEQARRS